MPGLNIRKVSTFIVMLSLVLQSFTPTNGYTKEDSPTQPGRVNYPVIESSNYQAPVFEHAEPRIGEAKEAILDQERAQQYGIQANTADALSLVYLSDLDPIFAIEGWSGQAPLQKDKSVGGRTITINGVTYTKGLGVHSYSEYVYELNQGYTSFLSDIGIDDEVDSAWCNYLASLN